MCGRYRLKRLKEWLDEFTDLKVMPNLDFLARYNIAPSQDIPVFRIVAGQSQLALLHWGLVPYWADDLAIGYKMINARAETVREKPSFRDAFKRRRCLIPADGFYEWKKIDPKRKQPYFIHRADDGPLAFAGLWEHNEKTAKPLDSATIITTTPNQLMAEIHDRMPVILNTDDAKRWIAEDAKPDELLGLLKPYPAELMEAWPVSTAVNSPKNQGAELIEPAREQTAK